MKKLKSTRLLKTNYIFHQDNDDCFSNSKEDNLDLEIEEYLKTIHLSRFKCAIEFWKAYEYKFPKIIMSSKEVSGSTSYISCG
jgi:hypothetical protein